MISDRNIIILDEYEHPSEVHAHIVFREIDTQYELLKFSYLGLNILVSQMDSLSEGVYGEKAILNEKDLLLLAMSFD